MNMPTDEIVEKVAATLVAAGSTFTEDKKEAYRKAIAEEILTQLKSGA